MAKQFLNLVISNSLLFLIFWGFLDCAISIEIVKIQNLKNHQVALNPDEYVDSVIFRKMQSEDEEDLNDLEEYEINFPEWEMKEKHPCQRPCVDGEVKTCSYEFVIEYYSTMSKACYNCPYNETQCMLPHCITGDGVKRTVLVINRQMPGPAIEVCYGDTIEVNVKNRMLDVSTTIHWHGLFQKDTPFMDGVPFVSQCLIPPQGDFLYRFFADNPGTHLWHSHSALQRGDGMYGPLIIREPESNDPQNHLYDFDLSEHIVTIIDWSHKFSVNKFVSHYHSNGDNKPSSILINGKGRFQEFRNGDEIIYTPAEKFTVKSGYRYRFRIINAGFLNCPIEISIDNHNMTVIASDGAQLEPLETETLVTVAGERFDIVLEANQEIDNYWIRFRGILDGKVKKAFQVAILHYEGADENSDPEGDVTYDNSIRNGLKVNAVNTPLGTENVVLMSEMASDLPENEDEILKPEADIKLYIPYDFYPVDNIHYQNPPYYGFYKVLKNQRTYTPQINHISMQFPSFPVMANLEKASELNVCNASSVSMECRFKFCECPHILQIPLDAVVEFILIDEGVPFEANHPFHLHGYRFRVLGMDRLGNSTTEEEVRRLDNEGLLKRNFINPPAKDTVTIPDGGYSILRFHATNPGYWILHCHLDFHVELGMALLFKVGDHSTFKSPPENFPMCGDSFQPIPINQTATARFFPMSEITKGTSKFKKELYTFSQANSLAPFRALFVILSALKLWHLKKFVCSLINKKHQF